MMNKEEKEFFYSIGRGSLNLNGKFYYGLDYPITDFMNSLEQENKKYKEVIDKANKLLKEKVKVIPFDEKGEGGGLELTDYDIQDLLDILKEVE